MNQELSEYNAEGTPLRKAQLASLDILIEFDRVCKENSLTYWIDFGSLLGAVRHKGFIPWDDDIDVSMPPADFKRFMLIGQEKLNKGYFLQTEQTDPGSNMCKGIFKIRKDDTLYVHDFDDFRKNYHKGVSIDVFEDVPYPTVSKGVFKFFSRRINKAFGFFHYNQRLSFKNIIGYFVFMASYLFFKGLWLLICAFKKKNRELTSIERVLYGYPTLKTDIFPLGQIEFENHMFPAPKNTDARLKCVFGDYMTLPPVEKRRIHAKYISLDTSDCYTNF